jgi:DMSO reductase anchor subunit
MNPAYSVIFFTVASGAGYGLLALLGILNASNHLPTDIWFSLVSLILSLGLITLGLLSSTLHLGHPERAWRALSQWRSSWLSREGVAAILTYIPAVAMTFGWLVLDQTGGIYLVMGILAATGAIITVYCTGKIYSSLKAIPAWNHQLVPLLYLTLSLTTGSLILNAMLHFFSQPIKVISILNIVAIATTLILKFKYWRTIDTILKTTNLDTATGLGDIGKIRILEKPHTSENYLQQEMGYKIARKHIKKLRNITTISLFILPIILIAISILLPPLALAAIILSLTATSIGICIERWLFFAEAKHVVMNYYDG